MNFPVRAFEIFSNCNTQEQKLTENMHKLDTWTNKHDDKKIHKTLLYGQTFVTYILAEIN